MDNYNILKSLAIDYLSARKHFLDESDKHKELSGNDNIIGRIGELIAIKYLHTQGRIAIKNESAVEKGYDLKVADSDLISVKIITSENKKGRTTKIKKPWTEIIIISLDIEYKVDRLGHITERQFEIAIKENFIFDYEPYTNRRMLNDNGLFDKYGVLLKSDELKDYL